MTVSGGNPVEELIVNLIPGATPMRTTIIVLMALSTVLTGLALGQNQAELRGWSRALDRKTMKVDAIEAEFRLREASGDGKTERELDGTMRWWRCGRIIKRHHDSKVVEKRGDAVARSRVQMISDGKYSWRVSDRDGVTSCVKDVAARRHAQGELYALLARYQVTRLENEDVSEIPCEVYEGRESTGKKRLRLKVWMDARQGFLVKRQEFNERGKLRSEFVVTSLAPLEAPRPEDFSYAPPRRVEVTDLTAPRPATEATLAKKSNAAPKSPARSPGIKKKSAPPRRSQSRPAAKPKSKKTTKVSGFDGMKRSASDALDAKGKSKGGRGGSRGGIGIR
jgi:outer membrane lipoprotein-sorting protein